MKLSADDQVTNAISVIGPPLSAEKSTPMAECSVVSRIGPGGRAVCGKSLPKKSAVVPYPAKFELGVEAVHLTISKAFTFTHLQLLHFTSSSSSIPRIPSTPPSPHRLPGEISYKKPPCTPLSKKRKAKMSDVKDQQQNGSASGGAKKIAMSELENHKESGNLWLTVDGKGEHIAQPSCSIYDRMLTISFV
mgnify:CR=1 FL=1